MSCVLRNNSLIVGHDEDAIEMSDERVVKGEVDMVKTSGMGFIDV